MNIQLSTNNNTCNYIASLNTYIKLLENKSELLKDNRVIKQRLSHNNKILNNIEKEIYKITDENYTRKYQLLEEFLNNARKALNQDKNMYFIENINMFCKIININFKTSIEEYNFWDNGSKLIVKLTAILTVVKNYNKIITYNSFKETLSELYRNFDKIEKDIIDKKELAKLFTISKKQIIEIKEKEWIVCDYIKPVIQDLLQITDKKITIQTFFSIAVSETL